MPAAAPDTFVDSPSTHSGAATSSDHQHTTAASSTCSTTSATQTHPFSHSADIGNTTISPSRPTLSDLPQLRDKLTAARLKGAVSLSAAAVTKRVREVQGRASEAAKRRLVDLGRALNDLTGYSGVEVLKRNVEEADQRVAVLQQQLQAARERYEDELAASSGVQKEMNSLLQRKSVWTDTDVGRFAELCRLEHRHEAQVSQMRAAYDDASEAVETSQMELMKIVRDRYVEESLWSDKIRRAQTWYTWGLVGVNLLSFVVIYTVVEPRKQRRLAATVSALLEQHHAAQNDVVRQAVHDVLRTSAAAAATAATASAGGDRWRDSMPARNSVSSSHSSTSPAASDASAPHWDAQGRASVLDQDGIDDLQPSAASALGRLVGLGQAVSSSSSRSDPDGGQGQSRGQLDEAGVAALRSDLVTAVRSEVQSLREELKRVLATSVGAAGVADGGSQASAHRASAESDAAASTSRGAGDGWDGQDVLLATSDVTTVPANVSRRTAAVVAGTAAVVGAVGTWLVLLALASGKRG